MIWLEVILSPFELILSAGSFRKAGGIDIEEGSRLTLSSTPIDL